MVSVVTISVAKDALLLVMCDKLPPLGEVFTSGDQERWLDAMRAILAFLYPPEWSQEAREKAKKAAAAHFPTITAPQHGRVTIGVPPDGFEPVLILPAETPNLMERIILDHNLTAKEELSRTFAGAVDDESGGEEARTSGAAPAGATSSPDLAEPPSATSSPPTSEPTSPSTDDPAPDKSEVHEPVLGEGVRIVPQPHSPATPFARRHFTADQRGALIRRVVREGLGPVSLDAMIHETTLRRWMREMPVSVSTFTEEWEAEQKAAAIAEGEPTVEEMEAERDTPIDEASLRRAKELAAKPAVQWPTAPIERRPFDPEQTRSHQAGQS